MSYSGKYKVRKPQKYKGDPSKVVFRSLWERNVFRWMEENDKVVWWNSEEVVIPYVCKTDGKGHRYFVDVLFRTTEGKTYLIEIKPHGQTVEPKISGRKSKRLLQEVFTWAKNTSKWEAARAYCREKGWIFQIWTERTLEKIGVKTGKRRQPRKKPPMGRKRNHHKLT